MVENYSSARFRQVIIAQGIAVLMVFAVLTVASLFILRTEIRKQILDRDGTFLTSLAQHLFERAAPSGQDLALLDVSLESSEIKNVIGVSLFNSEGGNMANIPEELVASPLTSNVLNQLAAGYPQISYFPELQMGELFWDIDDIIDDRTYPLTSVTSPVFDNDGTLLAAIQYWLDSEAVAVELRHLDQYLILLGSIFIAGGGLIFILVFWISRNRILKMGWLLAEQNRSLQKANADLSMAARTSAIGSISSHLFHGLKNPLAGLKAYLQVTGHDEEVLEITNRMQNLIDDALSVIRDEHQLNRSLSQEEFMQIASTRMLSKKEGAVEVTGEGKGEIPAHRAQLALLVTENLVDNAIEASPEGIVRVHIEFKNSCCEVKVSDTGPGLPDDVKSHLFEPVTSHKENGTGIGLAISSVIARHIPANLSLEKSDASGTLFIINIPL